MKRLGLIAGALVLASAGHAAEPGTAPLPAAVRALDGCWRGDGEVMGKPVKITLAAKPILLGSMIVVDADSVASKDATDMYAAHLLFGAAEAMPGQPGEPVSGLWADSFGGAFTATGKGVARLGSFVIGYRYPDAVYVNRWQIDQDLLRWEIDAEDRAGVKKPFAKYALLRAKC